MTITQEQFDVLVARLENEAARRPLWYKTRVFLLAMLGYAYVFGILAALLAIIAAVVAMVSTGRGIILLKNVAIPLAIFGWVVGKSLWVKLEPPSGRRLRREEVPRLFAAMDEICAKIDAPRAHVVLLDDQYNAMVSQIPRLGVFGWHRNYLVIGLPLMQAMPPDEWRGVLAHEFSHLSRAHARFSNWIYRVRKSWLQLMHTLEAERQGGGVWLFKRFFHWYAPYFGAYSFVLARRDEFEADRLAATVVGREAMARGFIVGSVRNRALSERFWPAIEKEIVARAAPPDDVHSRMAHALRAGLESAPVQAWVSDDLAVETGSADTHPCHRDRIAALGVDVDKLLTEGGSPAAPLQVSAAEYFLGDVAAEATAKLDTEWREQRLEWWKERHERERSEEATLSALEQRKDSLDDAELWELAHLTDSRRGADAAEPYLRELLRRIPDHAAASYTLGINLLGRGGEEGIAHIERAIQVDADATGPGSRTIAQWLRHVGRADEAELYEARAAEADKIKAEAAHERDGVYKQDSFLPHELDDTGLAEIRDALARFSHEVRRAWLVRKAVKHHPDQPLFVLGVELGSNWRAFLRSRGIPVDEDPATGQYVQAIADAVSIPCFVVPLRAGNAWVRKKMKKVSGAMIYRRGSRSEDRRGTSVGPGAPGPEPTSSVLGARSSRSNQ